MTKVVNLGRDHYDIYIGRAGHGHDGYFGNPFLIGVDGGRTSVLRQYCAYFDERIATDAEFRRRVLELRGKVLGCFCKPSDCHGDVIASWVNAQPEPSS